MNATFTTALAKTFSSSYSSSYIPTTITEKFTTPLAKTFSSSYPSSHIPTTITKKFTTTLAKTFRSSYPSSHIPTTITKKFTTPLAKTLRNTATKQFASLPKTFGRNYSTTKRILDTTISNVTEDMFDPFEKDISKNPEQSCKPAALPPKPMFGNEIGGFGSIIGVLMVDAAVFMTIIIIFSMLSTMIRKEQYPNEPTELNWLELFYGDCNAALRSCEIAEDMKKILGHPKSYFYWLRAILFLRMKDFLDRNGPDAVSYLSLQRHLIVLSAVISILSICCVIPVSYVGRFEGTRKPYARTVIANVSPKNPIMWFYPIMGFVFFAVALLFLKSYASSVCMDNLLQSNRTILIKHIAEENRSRETLELFFFKLFPDVRLDSIELAYNVKRLSSLNIKRLNTEYCLKWCKDYVSRTEERPQLIPKFSGLLCDLRYCYWCPLSKVDAIDYYTHKKVQILTEMKNEKIRTLEKPLSIAFVTFETITMLKYFLSKEFKMRKTIKQDPDLSFAHKWRMTHAPDVYNIVWENIQASRITYWILNFLLFAVYLTFVIFLSTPNIVLTILNLQGSEKTNDGENSVVQNYLPSLLLLILSFTLPLVVANSGKFLPFVTRSEFYQSMMIKTFSYLVIMILVLPITEFASIYTVFERVASTPGKVLRWDCIFLPDNGVFFSCYLIQAGLIGVCVQLLRIGELLTYCFLMFFAKSKAEVVSARRASWGEFDYGLHYAFYLVNFSVIVLFATAVPLVPLCGMIYLITKHCVDRYNIFFVNSPTHIGGALHATPINFAIFAFVLQQLILTAYAYIRAGADDIFTLYLAGLLFTFLIYLVQIIAPDVTVLRSLALPHTRRFMHFMRLKKALNVDTFHFRARAWSAYEVQEEDLIRVREYIPSVLQMDFRPETVRERLPGADLV